MDEINGPVKHDPFGRAFKILGIDKTKDKDEIRKAYVQKVRKTNPEDDQEAFTKLHDAYKTALLYCNTDDRGMVRLSIGGMAAEAPAAPSATEGTDDQEEDTCGDIREDIPSYDFSPIDETNAPPRSIEDLIISDIVEFKKINKLERFRELDHPNKMRLTSALFSLYRALALETDDTSVWDSFTEEPIVQYFLNDHGFRQFILGSVPGDTKHYDKIMSINEQYELSDRRQIEPVFMSQPKPQKTVPQINSPVTKERPSGVKILIPAALGLFMTFLVALYCKLNRIFDAPLWKIWLIIAGAVASVVIIIVLLASIKNDYEVKKWQ